MIPIIPPNKIRMKVLCVLSTDFSKVLNWYGTFLKIQSSDLLSRVPGGGEIVTLRRKAPAVPVRPSAGEVRNLLGHRYPMTQ